MDSPIRSDVSIDDVFAQHYERLVRALAVTHGLENAADAVQEAFAAAAERWSRICRYEDPAGWIRRVSINNLRSQRRNDERRSSILSRVHQARWGVEKVSSEASQQGVPAILDLQTAVRQLPEQQRMAIALYYLADLPVAVVARALEVSEGTVKSNLHDARANVRASLGEDYERTNR